MMQWLSYEIKMLLTGGAFGTICRILLAPDKEWKKWAVQVFVGISAAVFLGQIVGHIIINMVGYNAAAAAYGAAGYIIGTGAEKAIEKIQKKFLE